AGHAAEDIVVAGDSAGGHLAVDLLIENDRSRMPQPGAMVLFSPLIDLRFELASAQERGRQDPMISAAAARKMVEMYTGDHPADLPRLRLQLPRIDRLPPTLIQVGGAEMLVADARYLHNMIRQSGGSSTLEIWPDQMHVFQALPRLVPEAKQALRRAATFAAQEPEHRAQTPNMTWHRDEAVRERRKA
ncbi:MAG: alpha/beta hydrolase, partial [Rhodococcus sp. (in: high G+C Gram-positive bacteria)]